MANWSSDTYYIQIVEPMDGNDLMTSIKLEKLDEAKGYWRLHKIVAELGTVKVSGSGYYGTGCTFTEETWKMIHQGIVVHVGGYDEDVILTIYKRGTEVHTQEGKIYDTGGWKPFVCGTEAEKSFLEQLFSRLTYEGNQRLMEDAIDKMIPDEVKDKAFLDYLAERHAGKLKYRKYDFTYADPAVKAYRLQRLKEAFKPTKEYGGDTTEVGRNDWRTIEETADQEREYMSEQAMLEARKQ